MTHKMKDRVKVQVNKIIAFIPIKEYIKLYGNPTAVFHGHSLDIPMTFKQQVSKDEILVYEPLNGKHSLYNIDRILVKDIVVRFKDIEDYTHYQTELDFDESV